MKHESLSNNYSEVKMVKRTKYTEPESIVDTENCKESTLKNARKEKKKKAKAYSKKNSAQIFHVTWDAMRFVEHECEIVRHVCQLCEEDLLIAPVDDNSYNYSDQINYELKKYPEVSVLACGHIFHKPCLDQATPEEQCTDPICYICLSLDT